MPELRGELVMLRPATDADVDALVAILQQPEVTPWWGINDDGDVRERLPKTFVIEVDGEIAGALEWWEEDDPTYRHAGMDIYLAAGHQGRGLGTDAVRTAARWLFEGRGHHRLTIDPAVANAAAIACYTKVGFRTVGVTRKSELDEHTGKWRDGLMMDLLAEELA
jgi:aminoglycoside 6'-N-acetyltransferase